MTPEHIDTIRTLRAFGIGWDRISKEIGHPVDEIRAALGLPRYAKHQARPALPWEVSADPLADHPAPGIPSDR